MGCTLELFHNRKEKIIFIGASFARGANPLPPLSPNLPPFLRHLPPPPSPAPSLLLFLTSGRSQSEQRELELQDAVEQLAGRSSDVEAQLERLQARQPVPAHLAVAATSKGSRDAVRRRMACWQGGWARSEAAV